MKVSSLLEILGCDNREPDRSEKPLRILFLERRLTVRLRQMPVSVRIFRSRQFIYRPPCVFRRDEGMLFYSRDALFVLERERE
jgi:hypothetical protein